MRYPPSRPQEALARHRHPRNQPPLNPEPHPYGSPAHAACPPACPPACLPACLPACPPQNFMNKYSMQVYPLPNVVMVMQMAATWAIIHPLLALGYLTFPRFNWRTCQ